MRSSISGYAHDPAEVLTTTFKEVGGYQDMVLVRDMPFYSHCEHHMVPFMGKAHIAYYPVNGVVGISKLARLRRHLCPPPADAGDDDGADFRRARGVSRRARRRRSCWRPSICACRCAGVQKAGASTMTSHFTGIFKEDAAEREKFLSLVRPTSR